MANNNYDYPEEKEYVFSLRKLTSGVLLWMEQNNKKNTFPNKITLPPEEYIDFIQYTSQFINLPTFLGIPVYIRWSPKRSHATQTAVTKRRKKTMGK